jgi:glycosyltransferase involved in cell wall biosynthesis
VNRHAELGILFVINGLGTGGAERSLAELLPRLLDEGIRPVVACLYRRAEGVEEDVLSTGVTVHFLERRTLLGRVKALRQVIRSERPQIVHTTIYEADLGGRLAAWGLRPTVLSSLVNTPYDAIRLHDSNIRPLRLHSLRTIDGWTARHLTAHFHAISDAVKRAAVESLRIPEDRITVIPRGRDPERLGRATPSRRRAARTKLGIAEGSEVVLAVGRQEFQKGHRYLLEAAARLRRRRPAVEIIISGRRGNATAELEALHGDLRLADNVRFLGHRDDIGDLLSAADVFAFPSMYEGQGGAVVEAMALGLPIVASDLPAIREVVEEGRNALLPRRGDSAALADAIDALLNTPERRTALGRRSREIFEERYTLDRLVPRMVGLYRKLGGQRQPTEVVR